MNTEALIGAIDEELARLNQVRNLLRGGGGGVPSPLVGKVRKKKRFLSSEARERIAAAQRKRWAKQKKEAK